MCILQGTHFHFLTPLSQPIGPFPSHATALCERSHKVSPRHAEVAFRWAADDTASHFVMVEGKAKQWATSGEKAIIKFNLDKQSRS